MRITLRLVAAMLVAVLWSGVAIAKEVTYTNNDGSQTVVQDPPPSDDDPGEIAEIHGGERFELRHVGDKRFIDVSVQGRPLFSVPEQTIDLTGGGGEGYTTMDMHEFHLSPDHAYLFVEQKIVHCEDACTLYGPSPGGKISAIRPHGLPFDLAAVRAFTHVMHIHNPDFGQDTRVTHFEGWSGDGVDFSMGLSNFDCGASPEAGEIEFDWSGHYDFRTRRFSHIHIISIRDSKTDAAQ